MAYELKPSTIFKWAATGAVTAMNTAKQTLGWVAELPTMQNMNWLFQQITQHLKHLNERGIGDWDSATFYEFGGLTMHTDNEVYRCILTIPTRANSTVYSLGNIRVPVTYNGVAFNCTTAGTSGASIPVWNTTPGATTADGSVVWTTINFPAPSDPVYWLKYSAQDATTTVKGIAQVATTAEAQAWVSDADMMTPLKLKESGKSANQSLAIPTGYQNEPWGFQHKWGKATVTSTGTSTASEVTVTFATQFPTALANVQVTVIQPSGAITGLMTAYVRSPTASSFNIGIDHTGSSDAPYDVYWLAIGY